MKIYYRIHGDSAEIVRCFGLDSRIVLPGRIAGLPVRSIADYAFSSSKVEAGDVLVWEQAGDTLFPGGERLLAGAALEEAVFADTIEAIGKYTFYGCRELRYLEFSDSLTEIGSGAFTGCGKLKELKVHLYQGSRTCVKEILGDLWQRIDVCFLDHTGAEMGQVRFWGQSSDAQGQAAMLVFPEHYEEAVENTPARILFTQHHGSGNYYRQCFYNKEVDFRKYDELFPLAEAQESLELLADLVFGRLRYPCGLAEKYEKGYQAFVETHLEEIARLLVRGGRMDRLRTVSERGLWREAPLAAAIEEASECGEAGILSFLMDENHRLFPGKRRNRFEL